MHYKGGGQSRNVYHVHVTYKSEPRNSQDKNYSRSGGIAPESSNPVIQLFKCISPEYGRHIFGTQGFKVFMLYKVIPGGIIHQNCTSF